MKIGKKQLRSVVDKCLALSRDAAGTLDAARVKIILDELAKVYAAPELREILKDFYAAVARELRFSEVRIEFAGTLPAGTAESLAGHFSRVYQRAIVPVTIENPALLGGIRVSVGDDVIDASLAKALKKLA